MSRVENEHAAVEVNRLLAGAVKTVANARYCWLATATENDVPSTRPMGRLPRDPDDDEWTIRFVTEGRSRKASEIRHADKVAVIFQRGDDAFVTVIGAAMLREGAAEIRRRWKHDYDAYFPGEEDRANAAFVEIDAERLELWIRDITPEPFGLRTTVLERDASRRWRLLSRDHDCA
jgi:general stress protein 26